MTFFISFFKRLYVYQRERFPVVILSISLLPAILSSGAVVGGVVSVTFVIWALVVSVMYLLHIRIADEYRDFVHDSIHHTDRPLQRGLITLDELRYVDWCVLGVFGSVAVWLGGGFMWWGGIMIAYSWFARYEFFLGQKLRQHFFLYNAVNLLQMLLLQVGIYLIAGAQMSAVPLLLGLHFLFTTIGTIVFEFLRKVTPPGHDGTGADTYTWFVGFSWSLMVYALFAVLQMGVFLLIGTHLAVLSLVYVGWLIVVAVPMLVSLGIAYRRPTERVTQLLQLVYMVMYAGCNILIFCSI